MTKDKPITNLPRRVLVVEDDALISMSIEAALLDAGVQDVEICAGTEEALAALRRDEPDVIVLDVHLADTDNGWAVAELVRTLGPSAPRIIFSTGQPDAIPEDIADMGCILEKPYDPRRIVEALTTTQKKGILSRLRGAMRAS